MKKMIPNAQTSIHSKDRGGSISQDALLKTISDVRESLKPVRHTVSPTVNVTPHATEMKHPPAPYTDDMRALVDALGAAEPRRVPAAFQIGDALVFAVDDGFLHLVPAF